MKLTGRSMPIYAKRRPPPEKAFVAADDRIALVAASPSGSALAVDEDGTRMGRGWDELEAHPVVIVIVGRACVGDRGAVVMHGLELPAEPDEADTAE